ncbi:MAG: prepilin-type N-terminal cleavage/methylation domain-containing protein [Phycisphaera sp.]|nr:prepilin-type N-terminal cleavage/methylation domain-containing protein [Phycisphaera sp.]
MYTPRLINRSASHTRPRGFTIVEMLVVVSIIVLLMVLLIPTFSGAVERAEIVVCQSNEHQMYVALTAYAGEFTRALPEAYWATNAPDRHNVDVHGNFNDRWDQWHADANGNRRIAPYTEVTGEENPGGRLWPYMQDERVFVCPTSARLSVGYISDPKMRPSNSYSMLETVWHGWQGQPEIDRMFNDPNVVTPERQLLISEENPFANGSTAGYALNNSWLGASTNMGNPASFIDSIATYHLPRDRNLLAGGGDVLFFDGHVELTEQVESIDTKKLAFPQLYDAWVAQQSAP